MQILGVQIFAVRREQGRVLELRQAIYRRLGMPAGAHEVRFLERRATVRPISSRARREHARKSG
jgi:hypothetical protein